MVNEQRRGRALCKVPSPRGLVFGEHDGAACDERGQLGDVRTSTGTGRVRTRDMSA
jgi:hypothetical protein